MIKRRVELFASNELDILELQVNAWLDENPDCTVIDVKFSGSGLGSYAEMEPGFEIIYTALVFYEKRVE